MVIDPQRVKEIFLEATELPDEAARAAHLDKACGGDVALRARVEALLGAHDPEGSFLGTPAGVVPDPHAAGTTALDPSDRVAGPARPENESDDLHFLAPANRPDALGRLGHYDMLQVLGKGGFGIVFRAFDDVLQRVVAVKVMAPQMAATSPARRRFLREARSSAKVRHDNVVQVYEVGEQPLPYLVMEFIPGETLQQKLDRIGPLEVTEVVGIGRQVAEGLAAAHACDLIHRDIKPGNILLEGGSHKVKITDFGLARAADDASISQSGVVAGTPMFMAPEQALGQKIDQRADLFSLGSVLYQMASGRPPFRAPSALAVLKRVTEEQPRSIHEIIPETPAWLCDVIAKLHAKNPDERFQSAREVADLLANCEAQLKAKQAVKNVLPTAKPARRKWVAAAAVLLLPVIALIVTEFAGVTHLFRAHSNDPTPGVVVKKETPVPVDDAWVERVAALTAEKQVEVVRDKLKELNPDFDGQVTHKVEDGVVTELQVVTDKVTDISPIRVFHALRVLNCSGTHVNWKRGNGQLADLTPLKGMNLAGLLMLALAHTKVDDAGLAHFKDCKNLRFLGLHGTKVGDAGVAHFKDCKNLTYLYLGGTQVSDEGLAHFKDCKNLTRLSLDIPQVGDAGLAHFKDCKSLTGLWLYGTKVSDEGLAHFKDCKSLKNLNLGDTPVSDAGLFNFQDCKSLTTLQLGGTQVGDAGVAHFKGCKSLTQLELQGTKVGDLGLAHFEGCKNLTQLDLSYTPVGDTGLAHFEGCKNLTDLRLRGTKVTAAKIEAVKKALPKCRIEWDGGVIEPTVEVAPPAPTVHDTSLKATALLPRDDFTGRNTQGYDNQAVRAAGVLKSLGGNDPLEGHGQERVPL